MKGNINVTGITFGKGLTKKEIYAIKVDKNLCVYGRCDREVIRPPMCLYHREKELIRQQIHRQSNRERYNKRASKYRKPYSTEKEKRRMANWYSILKSRFGWDKTKVDAVLAEQQYLCAICRQHNNLNSNFALDHDHETGLPREFLCQRCNSTLGFVKDSTELLNSMVQYLEKHARVALS